MLKSVFKYATVIATTVTTLCSADCLTTLEVGVGYRRDFNKWDTRLIDPVGTEISSRLRFKDQDIILIDAKTKMMGDWFYIRAAGDYGWLLHGKVEEKFKVFTMSIEKPSVSSSNGKIKNNGSVADAICAIGYPFEFCCGDFILAPLAGYAYHYKRIKWDNHHFVPPAGTGLTFVPVADEELRSTMRWYGPLVGVDVFWRLDDCWNLWGEFQYIFGQCKRTGENNTGVVALDHFSRRHRAWGFDGAVGTDYFFDCDWYAGLSVDFKFWGTKKKEDTSITLPDSDAVGDELNWSAVGVNLNIGYLF